MRPNPVQSSESARSVRRSASTVLFEGMESRQMYSTTVPGLVASVQSPFTTSVALSASRTAPTSAATSAATTTPLYGFDLQQVAAGKMANGRSVAFALGGDGAVYYRLQLANNAASWGDWKNLGGNVKSITVTQGVGGKLQVVALGLNQSAYVISQSTANADAWTGWQGLGGSQLRQIAVSQNADARAEMFAVGGDSHVYTKWQSGDGSWSGWADLGGSVKSISVGQGLGGRMYCVGIGTNAAAWIVSQNAANVGWGNWTSLGGSVTQVVAGQDADGRFEAFALNASGTTYHQWQHYDGSWSGWVSLGGSVRSIAAGLDGGRLQVVAVGFNNQVYLNGQTTDNGNFGGWQNLGGSAKQISVGNDANGAIRVLSLNTDLTSSYGGPAVQNDPTVKIATRNGNELVVTASGSAVAVTVSQAGNGLEITADGKTSTYPIPAGGLFVYTRNGPDVVTIEPSVTCRTTVDTIDAAATTVLNFGVNAITWADSTDGVTSYTAVQRVGAFANGVSKNPGASLASPTDLGALHTASGSLFGGGPIDTDVNQRGAGDCWFMSSLASIAEQKPTTIANDAVDLGDGTYAVAFTRNGVTTYERVNNQLADGSAATGSDGDLWAPVMEKAFAAFRRGANTFASIDGGYVSEGLQALGFTTVDLLPDQNAEAVLFARLSNDMANHVPVALNVAPTAPELHTHHCYSVIGVTRENGVDKFIVRNPWGLPGGPAENAQGVASLTYAQLAVNSGWMTEAV